MANNFINKVKIGNDYYSIAIPYGTCSVAADTVAKTVSCSNFALDDGVQIKVKFTYANTAADPTLNVNSTGPKAIKVYGTTAATTAWKAGSVVDFTYDGTNWIITGFGALQETSASKSANVVSWGTGYITEGSETIATGSATTPTASGASTSTSLSGTTLTVARSVTPTVVPGYITTGTAGTVTITGTVPTETKSASGAGDITPSSGKLLSKVTVGSGSATTPTASGASTSTSLSGTTLTVARSVTPSVSAGWVASGTAGTVTITGTVPTETKSASGSGDITPSSGKLLSKVTVGAGSATPGATVSGSSSALTSPTAMNNQYFTVTPTASVGTAGWIASISNGTQLKYKVKDGALGNITGGAVHIDEILLNPTAANITLSTTDNGIPIRAEAVASADNATVSVSTAGWLNTSASKTLTGDSTSDTYTRYITAITVPKTTSFDLYMVAETGAETLDSDITIHTAGNRRVVIDNDEDGVIIHGANGRTVWVDGATVTNSAGELINTSVSRTSDTLSWGTGWITSSTAKATVTSINDVDVLVSKLVVANQNIPYKYTGATATRSGVTYYTGNIYMYE